MRPLKEVLPARWPRVWRFVAPILAVPHAGRVLRGASWSVAGAAVARLLSLASSVFLGRVLGTVGFGEYGVLNSTVGTLGPLSAMQVGLTSTKYVAQYKVADPLRAARLMAMTTRVAALSGGVTAVGLIAFSRFISESWLAAPGLAGPLAIAAVAMFFTSLTSAQAGALAGFEAFKELAWISAISGLFSLPLLVGGAYYFGILGVAISWSVSQGLAWGLNEIALRRTCRREGIERGLRPQKDDYTILWKFSVPSVLASTISGPALWASNAVLVNQVNGYEQMGIFAAASQWRTPVLFLSGAMASVLVPVLASISGTSDERQFRETLRFNVILNTVAALSVAIPIALFAPAILLIYGKQFGGGGAILEVLLVSAVLSAIGGVFSNAVVSQGRMRTVLSCNCIVAVVMVGTAVLLVPHYRAMGLAISITIQALVYLLFNLGAVVFSGNRA